jgi:hypothetical protein
MFLIKMLVFEQSCLKLNEYNDDILLHTKSWEKQNSKIQVEILL